MTTKLQQSNEEDWAGTSFRPGDLVTVHEWDWERGPGIVIGIDGGWDDGEPPGMEWTTYIEIQLPDGEIVSWDERMVTPFSE